MNIISLVVLPGTGQRTIRIPSGATLQTLAEQEELTSRQLCVNGQIVPRAAWSETVLSGRCEVAALAGSKGNASVVK